MGQADIYAFLKEHEGEWFTLDELTEKMYSDSGKESTRCRCIRKMAGFFGIKSQLKRTGKGNKMSIYYSYNGK